MTILSVVRRFASDDGANLATVFLLSIATIAVALLLGWFGLAMALAVVLVGVLTFLERVHLAAEREHTTALKAGLSG